MEVYGHNINHAGTCVE